MTFKHAVRRTHLYLGMILVPWILIYGISSLAINHAPLVRKMYDNQQPVKTEILNQPYERPVAEDENLQKLGRLILDDLGFSGGFHIRRQGKDRINISRFSFSKPVQIVYHLDEQRITAVRTHFRLDQFLVRMHVLGGYIWNSPVYDFWALMVDIFCLAMLTWALSGIYLWWKIPVARKWGTLTICCGLVTFLALII